MVHEGPKGKEQYALTSSVLIHYIVWLCLSAMLVVPPCVLAHPEADAEASQSKGRLSGLLARSHSHWNAERIIVRPVSLKGGAQISFVSPERWAGLGEHVTTALEDVHERFSRMFGEIPPFESTIRLMEEEKFFSATGAPRWTNALFFRGQIMIPLALDARVDIDNLVRSAKHEYVHAIIHALSAGACPGWLDEGLAQWVEGDENPGLRAALREHLRESQPVRLALLQGGFTRLDNAIVAAAYAQSLYAARHVLETFGVEAMSDYFRNLRSGLDREAAFESAFMIGTAAFERDLSSALDADLGPLNAGRVRTAAARARESNAQPIASLRARGAENRAAKR